MTVGNLALQMYSACFGSETVHYRKNPKKEGGLHALSRVASTAKGVSTLLGLGSRGGQLFLHAFPSSAGGGVSHVVKVLTRARGALSIPHLLTATHDLVESIKERRCLGITRGILDVGSTTHFVASALVADRAVASTLGGIGSTFKTFRDGIGFCSQVQKFFKYASLHSQVNKADAPVPDEVKQGIATQCKTALLKVARYALMLFSGVLQVLSFVFKVVIGKHVLIAGAIASLGSVFANIFSELAKEGARIIPVSKHILALHQSDLPDEAQA